VSAPQASLAVIDKKTPGKKQTPTGNGRPRNPNGASRTDGRGAGARPPYAPAPVRDAAMWRSPVAYEPVDVLSDEVQRVPFFLSPYIYAVLAALMLVAMGNLTTMFGVKDATLPNTPDRGWRFAFCYYCQNPQGFDWWGPSRVVKDF